MAARDKKYRQSPMYTPSNVKFEATPVVEIQQPAYQSDENMDGTPDDSQRRFKSDIP